MGEFIKHSRLRFNILLIKTYGIHAFLSFKRNKIFSRLRKRESTSSAKGVRTSEGNSFFFFFFFFNFLSGFPSLSATKWINLLKFLNMIKDYTSKRSISVLKLTTHDHDYLLSLSNGKVFSLQPLQEEP